MIASLTGTIDRISLDSVIITVGGVGYRVFATPDTLATFSRGSTATVLTELVVREDSLTLYGFAQPDQQELFLLLQKVSGIGPRMALSILSVLHARAVRSTVPQRYCGTAESARGGETSCRTSGRRIKR